MKNAIGASLGLVAALFLSACEFHKREPAHEGPARDAFRESSDVTRQQMLVEVEGEEHPLNVNVVLSNKDLLFRALETQFPSFKGPDDLGGYLTGIEDRLKEGIPDVPEFQGYGGVLNRAFFQAARKTLGSDLRYNPLIRVRLVIYGQIINYKFDEETDSAGNPLDMGSGEIHSITYFTCITTPNTPDDYKGPNISTTDAILLKAEVRARDGFRVVERDDGAEDGPFPETMAFTPAMINDIEFYGYQYKLWAEGDDINITDIFRKNHGETVFTRLPSSHPHYVVGPDSCIDMLFVDRPPADLGSLGPPFYCLGRCRHPGLVNTNAS